MPKASDQLLRRFALHEAGHAVACVVLGRRLRFVELRQTKDGPRGRVVCGQHPELDPRRARNRARVRRMVEREIMIAWAGLAAEGLFYKKRDLRGLDDDARTIVTLLARLERTKRGREDLGASLLGATRKLLRGHRGAVRRTGDALRTRRRLTVAELRREVSCVRTGRSALRWSSAARRPRGRARCCTGSASP